MVAARLGILLASPRGFCAGVDRAIKIVKQALVRYGPPVYVRHEIVHNAHVVDRLRTRGVVFVDELSEVPQGVPVIFSAHGVPRSVIAEARTRRLTYIDATCPLVSKVHSEVYRHITAGREVILVGHSGHPEVIGIMGQLAAGRVHLVETETAAGTLALPAGVEVAVATQTTLSLDETAAILAILRRRFPGIIEPRRSDICYATTNRQQAAKALALRSDAVVVIGASNSSNSNRLHETVVRTNCAKSMLLGWPAELDWDWLGGVSVLGIISSASAPEFLVQDLVQRCQERFLTTVEELSLGTEVVEFKLPRMPCADGKAEPTPALQASTLHKTVTSGAQERPLRS